MRVCSSRERKKQATCSSSSEIAAAVPTSDPADAIVRLVLSFESAILLISKHLSSCQ